MRDPAGCFTPERAGAPVMLGAQPGGGLQSPFGSASRTLIIILALGFTLRVVALFVFPTIHHPDEAYQMLEQAHRLAFGYGVMPWEFSDGVRSLVVPYLLSKVFIAGNAVFGGPDGYIDTARIVLAGISLIAVAAVYRMGARISPLHGFLAGLVMATWFEIVYFAPKPVSEAMASDFLLIGLSLVSVPDGALTRRRLILAGFCIGLTLMLRIHLAFGVVFLAAWVCRTEVRARWLPMLLGGVLPVAVFGIADWISWGSPFFSFIQAIRINLVEGKASTFGVSSVGFIVDQLVNKWGGALPVIFALICFRARRSMMWTGVALAIIISHSAVPHKEYRFFLPAVECLMVIAALGSADLIERARAIFGAKSAGSLTVAVAFLWVGTSVCLSFAPGFFREWRKEGELIRATSWLSKQPALCGVLVYDYQWGETPGYAFLHRNVPIYSMGLDSDMAKNSTAAFNYILLSRASLADFMPEYATSSCFGPGKPGDVCAAARSGACTPDIAAKPWLELKRLGDPNFDQVTASPYQRLSHPSAREVGP